MMSQKKWGIWGHYTRIYSAKRIEKKQDRQIWVWRPHISILVSLMAIYILFMYGCGYGVTPGGEFIDKSIQTVFVDNFINSTSEAGLENSVRSAFIDQFIRGRRLKLVSSREAADALFRGSITNVSTTPLSYTSANLAAEERLTVTMELILEEQGAKNIIWSDKAFSATQDYVFANLSVKERNRRDALTKLSNDSAEKAYRLMMSGF
jgi:hypothetical protein